MPMRDKQQADEPVVEISELDKNYLIYLPNHETDYIQRQLFNSKSPYELYMLRDMAERLSKGDLVIDVGANIGNHSLYLAAVIGCRVVAFEPNGALAAAIKRSVALNGLANRLHIRTEGVGARSGLAGFAEARPDNLGAQRLIADTGDIRVIALDKAKLGKPVRMIKIDVEGVEAAVLEGARKIIARDRPILYVESATETHFREVQSILKAQSYLLWDTFNATPTHLFVPSETVTPESYLHHLKTREVLESFRHTANVETLRQQLNDSNLKYRTLSGQLADARGKYSSVTQQLVESREEAKANAADLTDALGEARTRAEVLAARLADREAEQAALQTSHDEMAAALEDARGKYSSVTKHLAEARTERDSALEQTVELKVTLEARTTRLDAVESMRTGQIAALDELRWDYDKAIRQLERTEAALHAAKARVAQAETSLFERPRAVAETSTVSSVADVVPELMAGWVLALDLRPQDLTTKWLCLAENLREHYPEQRVALLRTLAAIPEVATDPQVAHRLGIALMEEGLAAEACATFDHVVDDLNLSSRESRLVALARQAVESENYNRDLLRQHAEQVVRSRLRVAAIMDEFTALGYGPECDLQQLSVGNWKAELEAFKPEIMLFESAWRGLNDEWGSKAGQISAEIRGILDWCKANGVPTAFWNKEDPVHFETFLNLAQKMDLVFTTDIDCIPRYKAALGHERVQLLPFACQPELHNPIEQVDRKAAFCFAGAYYVRYPDRTQDLDDFLEHLTEHLPFEIFDRNFGKDHPDYMFPDAYQPYIVGTLHPSEIDRAYKGYDFGINLNSVKHSQTMFARRVYELMASNTRVVSNYAPGLRRLFGDLLIATDSGAEALRRIRQQDNQGIVPRLRLAGLRKVMSEHSYSHRIGQIARAADLNIPDPAALPDIVAVGQASDRNLAVRLLATWQRQHVAPSTCVLIVPEEVDLSGLDQPANLRRLTTAQASVLTLGELVGSRAWLAGFVPKDYYGAHYLQDLILATRYSRACVLGKASYHRMADGVPVLISGSSYRPVDAMALRRSIQRGDQLECTQKLDDWLSALLTAEIHALEGRTDSAQDLLALDPFSYCEDGGVAVAQLAPLLDTPTDLDVGLSGDALQAIAQAMPAAAEGKIDPAQMLSGATLVTHMQPPANGKVTWTANIDGSLELTSTLDTEEHIYVYEHHSRPLADLTPDGIPQGAPFPVYAMVEPGLSVIFVAVWEDAKRKKISNQIFYANKNAVLTPAEGTAYVRFGMRPRGPGQCTWCGIKLAEHAHPPRPVIGTEKEGAQALVLTNHYPSYQDLYRNGFVHSRLRAYRELGGLSPDVYRLRPDQDLSFHEFQNIEVMTGSAEQLDFLLASGRYDHVLVHFLDTRMWNVLSRYIDRVRVTVWVHGAEVQPWWRRSFNYATQADLDAAKPASDARLAFWRGLFAPLHPNLHFVFVSQYFAEEVFEDLEVTCPPAQYQVIHNPIDDQLFAYHEKPVEQRGRILSIRPFASRVYANDLTVQAILALQRRDFFDQLEFRIIGDGPLFDEVTAPLQGFANVTLEKRFLLQQEIAALHRDHGIFLSPSRSDTQGVSRDEAMSSGLVPITSRVAAIPEFVDDHCGYLAEAEDAEGLARAITEMWKHPEIFAAKSRAAAERVRGQSGRDKVIGMELALIRDAEKEKA